MGGNESQSSSSGNQVTNSSNTTISPFAFTAGSENNQLFGQAQSLLGPLLNQIMSALNGKMTNIPLIQSALGSAKNATNTSYQQTLNAFAQAGLGNDPLSQGILGGILMQGAQSESQIPAQIDEQFIGMAPSLITGLLGSGSSSLAQALAGYNTQYGQQGTNYSGNTSSSSMSFDSDSATSLGQMLGSVFSNSPTP